MGVSQRTQRNILLSLIFILVAFLILDDEDLQHLTGFRDLSGEIVVTEFRAGSGSDEFGQDYEETTPVNEEDSRLYDENEIEDYEDEEIDDDIDHDYDDGDEEEVTVTVTESTSTYPTTTTVIENSNEEEYSSDQSDEARLPAGYFDDGSGFMKSISRYLTPGTGGERILTDPRIPGPKAFDIRRRQVVQKSLQL